MLEVTFYFFSLLMVTSALNPVNKPSNTVCVIPPRVDTSKTCTAAKAAIVAVMRPPTNSFGLNPSEDFTVPLSTFSPAPTRAATIRTSSKSAMVSIPLQEL